MGGGRGACEELEKSWRRVGEELGKGRVDSNASPILPQLFPHPSTTKKNGLTPEGINPFYAIVSGKSGCSVWLEAVVGHNPLFQFFAGKEDSAFNGAERQVEFIRDFLVFETFEVHQERNANAVV